MCCHRYNRTGCPSIRRKTFGFHLIYITYVQPCPLLSQSINKTQFNKKHFINFKLDFMDLVGKFWKTPKILLLNGSVFLFNSLLPCAFLRLVACVCV